MEHGIYWAGMVQGLIHDVPSVAELIERTIADTETIIQKRLLRLLAEDAQLPAAAA